MATSDNDWYNMPMLIVSMFSWWYTSGWKWVIARAFQRLDTIQQMFSVRILLRTLLAPWKQIVGAPDKNQSLDAKFRMMLDNLISRFVGLAVRSLTLLAAFVSLVFVLLIGVFTVFLWPLLPLSILAIIMLFLGAL